MTLNQILRGLWARQWMIWATMLIAAGVAYLITSRLPSRYTATATVLLDIRDPNPLGELQSGAALSPTYMNTQVDIINSDRVAARAIQILKLNTNPQAVAQWLEATGGSGTIEQFYEAVLHRFLEVKPSRNSTVIAIQFSNPSADYASAVANAFAKAYLETNVELRADPAKDFAAWFNTRTKQIREQLETAQAKLSQFQREHGIVATDERGDVENSRLAELNAQLTTIQNQRMETSSREHQATIGINSSPDVNQSPLVASLRGDIALSESKLAQLSKQYGPNHPEYQRSKAELDSLRLKLDSEMRRVVTSVNAANAVNVQHESEVRSSLNAQEQRILAMRAQRDSVAVLQRDVETAQRAYDLVTQRLTQTSLESEIKQTNVLPLSDAVPPLSPAWPHTALNVVISALLGLVVGATAALLVELSRPRVRAAEDVLRLLEVPVLVSLPRTPSKGWRVAPPIKRARLTHA
jgi:chain length determinant protein EpsF